MDKSATLKGFRDITPPDALARQYLLSKIRTVVESFGYDPIETPTLEYAETLLGKYGPDADKLIFTFVDRGGRRVGLRYDQTVPTARFVCANPRLALPLKRYQIQPAFRQENPQKGRFREFLQFDVDIFGLDTRLADAEILAVIYRIYQQLGFKKFKIKINNRAIIRQIMAANDIPADLQPAVIRQLDKLDKFDQSKVSAEIVSLGIKADKVNSLFDYLEKSKPDNDLSQTLAYLKEIIPDLDCLEFVPTLARGLDYYTGLIFEVAVDGYTAGSVLGGGRYNKLISQLGGPDLPAVGFAIGFDRTLEAARQLELIPKLETSSRVLVTVFSEKLLPQSIKTANLLRQSGINTEIFLNPSEKLDRQLKYANKKGIPWVILIGENETSTNLLTLKNMESGRQETLPFQTAITRLNE